jgi:hypothetical protein
MKRSPLIAVALLLWALGLALAYRPDAFYVATNGSDSNNGISSTTPFLTVQKAVNSLTTPPQKIYIATGVYDERVTISSPRNDPGLPGYQIIVTGAGPVHLTGLAITIPNVKVDPLVVVGPTATATATATQTAVPTATPT